LVPLPPEIWRALPGRTAETAIIDLAGGSELARPLALNPNVNLQLFASLTALSIFALTVARLDSDNVNRLLRIILGIALIQLFVGVIQFTSAGTSFDFFGNSHKGWLLGTFANRNHAGLFFACCILISVALLERNSPPMQSSVAMERIILQATVPLWLLAAIGTGSRTGFMLALVAAGIAGVVIFRGSRLPVWAWVVSAVALVATISAVSMSERVQRLVDRYDSVSDDQRWSIWQNSVDIITNYMPWGSGFGSFVAVYNKSEPIEELIPQYVNNAHNDYLELLVEAGFPGAIVLGFVALLVIIAAIRGVRSENLQVARHSLVGGGIILLFACHSVVDYPVRRMATAIMLFLAFGLLLRQFGNNLPKGTRVLGTRHDR
jgi:O-antigen ligase